jgi:hypothetical protein
MHRGLPVLQRRLDSMERPLKLDWAPIPREDEPSPELDQHESSHSHRYYM